MLIYKEKVYSYLREWLNLYAIKYNKNGFVTVFTGGLDSLLTSALCLRAASSLHTTIIFMGFKPENEKLFEQWIVSNFSSEYYSIVRPNHPEIKLPNIEHIDYIPSLIPTYVDLYCKNNDALAVGSVTKSEYSLVKLFKTRIDDVYDCYPVIDLYKSECKELAILMQLPGAIVNSKSLMEDSFGFNYDDLEWVVREDENIKIVSSLSTPNGARFWGLYNEQKKKLTTKVYQLTKQNKEKSIPVQEMCLVRTALPGVIN